MTPVIAAITQPLIDFATNVIDAIGAWGVFVLMLLESACIPIPSEATMLFAGMSSAKPDPSFTFAAAVFAGVAGNVVGSCITWWLGRIGRADILETHGGKIGIRKHHLEVADRWFREHGEATVFFSRMLPIVRTFISLPAGAARMPFWRFTIYTTLGCIPWVLLLTWGGVKAGEHWDDVKHSLEYVDYAMAAAIIGVVVWLVVRSRKGKNSEPGSDAAAG